MTSRALAAAAVALALAACRERAADPLPPITLPPTKYQGDVTVAVRFVADPEAICGAGHPLCMTGPVMVAPNPCRWTERLARGLCHEIGHKNGWPADHPPS